MNLKVEEGEDPHSIGKIVNLPRGVTQLMGACYQG
jgi:hypothetical protein